MGFSSENIKKAIEIISQGGGRKTIKETLGISEAKARDLRAIAQFLIDNNQEDLIDFEAIIERANEQVKYWKRKYKEAIKKIGFQREITAVIENEVKSIKPLEPISTPLNGEDVSQESITLLLGDFHAGEVVSEEELLGINKYDFKIFLDRLGHIFGTALNIANQKLKGYQFTRLNIDLLGDLVSGDIHDELKETNEPNTFVAVVYVAYALAQAISSIAPYFPEIHIHGIIGNHGRKSKTLTYKESTANFDYLVYQFLKALLRDHKNITFDFPSSWFLIYESQGFNIGMFHGDGIRNYYGIPFYGISKASRDLFQVVAKKLNKRVDIWEIGHFHQPAVLPENIFLNGSLIGANEFSIKAVKSVSPPCQWLYGVHPKRGVTFIFNLNPEIPSKHAIKLTHPKL